MMGSQESNPRKYDDDHWVSPFRMLRRVKREAASQSNTTSEQMINLNVPGLTTQASVPLRSPPQILAPQKCTSSKYNGDHWVSPFRKPFITLREEAIQSSTLTLPSPPQVTGSQDWTLSKYDGDLGGNSFKSTPVRTQHETVSQSKALTVPAFHCLSGSRVLPPRKFNPFRMSLREQREEIQNLPVWKVNPLVQKPKSLIQKANPFGKLPAEVRLMIYEYTLASQSPIKPRLKVTEKAASTQAQEGKDGSSIMAPNASSLALLQTCRLIYWEAQPVYYASNTFRFTSAKDLQEFLQHIGPALRAELKSLHIEGLLTIRPMFTVAELQAEGYSDAIIENLSPYQIQTLGEDAYAASSLLEKCNRLRRMHLVMEDHGEMAHIHWLRILAGYFDTMIEIVDAKHWIIRSSTDAFEFYKALDKADSDRETREILFPPLEGQQRCVDVDLNMDRKVKALYLGLDSMAM